MNELLRKSAVELAAMIQRREVSPREVIEAHITHVKAINPSLNALVAERFESALREADEVGRALLNGTAGGPFAGVPFTAKEAYAVAGLPNTAGTLRRKSVRSERDAIAVARLKASGGIALGVSNVPEFCLWMECYNFIYGRTNNPYNLSKTPGGSSGGEAALVASGASPIGLGSDIGGSIRMPAFFCGIFGHKPSAGMVPLTGHWPMTEDEVTGCADEIRYATAGPLARSAQDLMPLLKVLAGCDPSDRQSCPYELGDPGQVSFQNRRVYMCEDPGVRMTTRPTATVRAAVQKACEILAERGAHVEPFPEHLLRNAMRIWRYAVEAASALPTKALMGGGKSVGLMRETMAWLTGRPRYSLPALEFCWGDFLTKFKFLEEKTLREAQELRTKMADLLQDGSVLVLPPHPREAPGHYWPLLKPFDISYTGIFNILEMPATAIPMGLTPQGMPTGVQIISGRGLDHVTIGAALVLEQAVGGWQPPVHLFNSRTEGSLALAEGSENRRAAGS